MKYVYARVTCARYTRFAETDSRKNLKRYPHSRMRETSVAVADEFSACTYYCTSLRSRLRRVYYYHAPRQISSWLALSPSSSAVRTVRRSPLRGDRLAPSKSAVRNINGGRRRCRRARRFACALRPLRDAIATITTTA